MGQEVKIEGGENIIIKDGKHENVIIMEGTVNSISDIPGTTHKRIHCEGPFLIDVEQD
jgi:hypothetical protein